MVNARGARRGELVCGVLAAGLLLASAFTATAAEDKTIRNMLMLEGDNHRFVQFVDTDSVRRNGDQIDLDLVSVGYRYAFQLKSLKPGEGVNIYDPAALKSRTVTLDGSVTHLRVSCGWWTVTRPDSTAKTLGNELPRGMHAPDMEFMAGERVIPIVERLCRGESVVGDGSLRSTEAAIARAKKIMDPPVEGIPPPGPAKPDPVQPDWVGSEHDFTLIPLEALQSAVPADERGLMFVDRKPLTRTGDRVEGVTLLMMGSRALRYSPEGNIPVVMRRMAYDCAAGVMWVQAEARWNRFGILDEIVDKPSAARSRAQSPIIAAEIDAVCAGSLPVGGPRLASLDDAWTLARKDWPDPAPRPYRLQCLFDAMPDDWKEALLTGWAAKGPDAAAIPPGAMEAALVKCGVAEEDKKDAAEAMTLYVPQRGALAFLKTQGIAEPSAAEAFDNLTWRQRQRLKKSVTSSSPADREFQADMANRMAEDLRVANRAAAMQVYVYMMTRAGLMLN